MWWMALRPMQAVYSPIASCTRSPLGSEPDAGRLRSQDGKIVNAVSPQSKYTYTCRSTPCIKLAGLRFGLTYSMRMKKDEV